MSHEPNLKLVNGLRFQLDSALETIAKFLTANFYKKFKENKVVFQFKRNLSFLKLLDAFFIHFDNLIKSSVLPRFHSHNINNIFR